MLAVCNTSVRLQSRVTSSGATVKSWMIFVYLLVCLFLFLFPCFFVDVCFYVCVCFVVFCCFYCFCVREGWVLVIFLLSLVLFCVFYSLHEGYLHFAVVEERGQSSAGWKVTFFLILGLYMNFE